MYFFGKNFNSGVTYLRFILNSLVIDFLVILLYSNDLTLVLLDKPYPRLPLGPLNN